jgi:hypothetical protein
MMVSLGYSVRRIAYCKEMRLQAWKEFREPSSCVEELAFFSQRVITLLPLEPTFGTEVGDCAHAYNSMWMITENILACRWNVTTLDKADRKVPCKTESAR